MMTIRARTKALTTGPGEKLRNALGLGLEHSGTCAQLARAISQYKNYINKNSGNWGALQVAKCSAIQLRINGLTGALGERINMPLFVGRQVWIAIHGESPILT